MIKMNESLPSMQKFKLHISFLAVLLLQISALLGSHYLIHYTGHKWSITMHQKTKSKNNNNLLP